MKKFILSAFIALAAATSSFAQFSNESISFSSDFLNSGLPSYDLPSISLPCYDLPSISLPCYDLPSISLPRYDLPSLPSVTTVSGYYKDNGTYVDSYVRTSPNSTNWDNFSTSGNSNPYTGSTGYRARDYSSGAYNYGSGQTIYTGPRGGQYYYNSNGRKTYVPKR